MRKAYSYARYSNRGQSNGSSVERQIKIAREWHAREIAPLGIPLDESLGCDEGYSALKGDHIKKGSLGQFLAEIKAGRISRGSILIAENLDRISRQGSKIARKIIEQIVDQGVDVHICNVSVKLTVGWENDLSRSVIVDVELGRALGESQRKVELIGKGWDRLKRNAALNGTAMSGSLPAWLKVENGKVVAREDKVVVLKEMFRLAGLGLGARHITRTVNSGLSLSWVLKTLRNRAVLGEYQPTKIIDGRHVNDGPVVFGYYPQVIGPEEWSAARGALDRKIWIQPGGNQYRGGARNTDRGENLFTGLLYDVTTEPVRSMNFQRKTGARFPWLISAWDKTRKGNRLRYDKFEAAFLHFLEDLDWKSITGQSESDEYKSARAEFDRLSLELDKTERLITRRSAEMDDPELDSATVKVFASTIANAQVRAKELKTEKEALSLRLEAIESKSEALYSPENLRELIRENTPESNELRLKLRAEIRRRVTRIDLQFHAEVITVGPVENIEAGTGRKIAKITFVNGASRLIVFQKDDVVAVWMK